MSDGRRFEILKGIYHRRGLFGTLAVFIVGPLVLAIRAIGSSLVAIGCWLQVITGKTRVFVQGSNDGTR